MTSVIPTEAVIDQSAASAVSVLHHALRNDLTLAYGALELIAEAPELPPDLQGLTTRALQALDVAQQRLAEYR